MRIICFGDSLTSCGGPNGRFSDILQDRFPDHEFINAGVGGETLVDAKARLKTDVLDNQPDGVLIEFGANDWGRNERPVAEWVDDLRHLITEIQAIGAKVIVLGVFGNCRDEQGRIVIKDFGTDDRGRDWHQEKTRLCEEFGVPLVPNIQERIGHNRCCWRDRNHPNEYGNRFVADTIEPVLETLLGCPALPLRKNKPQTLLDFWNEAVSLTPSHLAACDSDARYTYNQADAIIQKLAAGLQHACGSHRPKVAVYLPNCADYFLIYWATMMCGGTIVPLNTWLRKDALCSILQSVEADILITAEPLNNDLRHALSVLPDLPVFYQGTESDTRHLDDLKFCSEKLIQARVCPDDAAIIMHTSGTTSLPKGAVMRHSDLMFNVMATINAQGFVPDDIHLIVNPMFHCTALYSSLPAAAYQKSSLVITAEHSPDGLMELIQKEKVTTCLTVPSILQRVVGLSDLSAYEPNGLRLIGYAGSPMPQKTIHKLNDMFPDVSLRNFFGLTETTSATHVIRGEAAVERATSIGRLLPFVRAIVVDESHTPLPHNEVGELLFARDNVISTYWKQPGRLEESFSEIDGDVWFRTGDLAMIDDDGFFYIKGRKKDMIIVGGENVFAVEVESVLQNHPEIKEAAVVGIPATGIRESLGECIKAVIVPDNPDLTEHEVRKHCHTNLVSYQIPQVIEFRAELPRNATGKVVKAELK